MDLEFRDFLSKEMKATDKGDEKLTENAIKARLSRANRIEKELNIDLNEKTKDVKALRDLKRAIKENYTSSVASTLYNTATRYYKYLNNGEEPEKNHREFLRL